MNPALHPLNLKTVLALLSVELGETLKRQCVAENNPALGGWINAQTGVDEQGSAAAVLGVLLAALWGHDCHAIPLPLPRSAILDRARLAAEYLLRVQAADGLIDLLSCNYSSSPDMGFAVQRLGVGLLLVEQISDVDADLQAVLGLIKDFLPKAAAGMLTGGFHTPNHRWMISSALAVCQHFLQDVNTAPVIEAYLAEGVDVDADGAFTEHSTGVYDAVCNLSLLILGKFGYEEQTLSAVKRNLTYNLTMIHPDGSAETGLSHRQDMGTRPVPLDLGAAYLLYQSFERNPDFAGMVNHLWQQKDRPTTIDLLYLAFGLNELPGQPHDTALRPPEVYAHYFPCNQFWRMRQENFSVSAFAHTDRILNASNGTAYLSAVRISQSYFGVGRFIAEEIEEQPDGIVLHSSGMGHAIHRPGYDLPLGVPVENVYASREKRDWRALPPAKTRLSIRLQENGIHVHYETIENHPGVLAQIAFDFAPGGVWECAGGSFQPQAGQTIFLREGLGRMLYGQQGFEIGPGADQHRYWEMRDTPPAPHLVRVVIPLITPVDHQFVIRPIG